MADEKDFPTRFHELTGVWPLSWQHRLYEDYFTKGSHALPGVIDLPTGLGKTMVMAIWLIALEKQHNVPTRLIYVVDRRTVVDQATNLAEKLRCRFGKDKLAISTLRGQLADNREWSTDPSKPAIIIGTVDLIGSALLFSGYRSSYKRRPLEAGLLGQDSLLLLDEAHLSKPFEKLVKSICKFQERNSSPMRVVRMSATSGEADSKAFQLIDSDFKDPIISQRVHAKKELIVKPNVDAKKVNAVLADAAIRLATDPQSIGKRIVVFVRRPDDAIAIAGLIRSYTIESIDSSTTKPKRIKTLPYRECVQTLTGTMRGLERDELIDKDVFKDRWLNGNLDPSDSVNQQPVFLVSTSAGEVGFDLNADHLVGDSAPIDSWIQRLGRVNRRGNSNATVILIKQEKPADKTDFDNACIAASNLLTDGMELSPNALAKFKTAHAPQLKAASTPEPTMVELTDILLDAWSMTSIVEPMPGRPEVGPWLRGTEEDAPQTTIAWRAELELLEGDADPKSKFKEIFNTHRIRPHESLTIRSTRVIEFLQKLTGDKQGRPALKATRVVVKLSRDLFVKTIGDLVNDPSIFYSEPTLILPSTFGGLENGILLHENFVSASEPDAPSASSLDVADHDGYESRDDVVTRWRIVLERKDGSWKPVPLTFGREQIVPIVEVLGIKDAPHSHKDITAALLEKDLRTREIIKFDLDDEGDPRKLLLLLSGISRKSRRTSQPLDEHIAAVEAEAMRIADNLHLKSSDPSRDALLFAAKWHDDGKRSAVWQRFIGGSVDYPLGKSAKYCDPRKLGGYRHEFGSLLRVVHPDPAESREKPQLPDDENVQELALHLLGSHHGHERPHFASPIDRDFHKPSLIDQVHADAMCRFARLQRKYGWWHLAWLENLLRCADAIASAQVNDDENQDDEPEVG